MAHDNKEVEIKVKIDDADADRLRALLRGTGDLLKKVDQSDEYFSAPHRDFVGVKFPFEWLSIRVRDGKGVFNYKHFHPENAKIKTYCDEFESQISNPDSMRSILIALGFSALIKVAKVREVFRYRVDFEVAVDTVEGLGTFIEIEALKDFGSIEDTRNMLLECAKDLGVDASSPDLKGYPYLLLEKHGLLVSEHASEGS